MNDALIVSILSAIPKNRTAAVMGAATRLRLPAVANRALLRWFVAKYGVNLDECQGTLDDYPSLARFFIRELKPGLRPIDPDPEAIVSPVDGRTHTFGTIEGGHFLQADGKVGGVSGLIGEDARGMGSQSGLHAARFEGGSYAVLYLSPKDYHRVHSPCDGRVVGMRYLPGRLWPVFPAATRKVDNLFDRNERLVFHLDTAHGAIVLAMIGAFGVGRMATPLADIVTNTGGRPEDRRIDPGMPLARGAELGRFEMGSTVILLAEPGRLTWELSTGEVVRLGRTIARTPPSLPG